LTIREVEGLGPGRDIGDEGLHVVYFSTSLVTFAFAQSSVTNILALEYWNLFLNNSIAFVFQTSIKIRREAPRSSKAAHA